MTTQHQNEYKGSCHCQTVTYQATVDTSAGMMCNCSYCGRRGYILGFIPESDFELLSGEDNLTEYRFNRKTIAHLFCKTCGVQCFAKASKDGAITIALNLRTIHDFDPEKCSIKHVDGRSF